MKTCGIGGRAIDLALADIVEREQIGRQLQKRYTEFLAAK